jgi:hypothetical protein
MYKDAYDSSILEEIRSHIIRTRDYSILLKVLNIYNNEIAYPRQTRPANISEISVDTVSFLYQFLDRSSIKLYDATILNHYSDMFSLSGFEDEVRDIYFSKIYPGINLTYLVVTLTAYETENKNAYWSTTKKFVDVKLIDYLTIFIKQNEIGSENGNN